MMLEASCLALCVCVLFVCVVELNSAESCNEWEDHAHIMVHLAAINTKPGYVCVCLCIRVVELDTAESCNEWEDRAHINGPSRSTKTKPPPYVHMSLSCHVTCPCS